MPQGTDLIKNPIKRDGVSRWQRKLEALVPSFVKVDERSLEDFLVFALEFSRQVRFFNPGNQADGNWEDFWGFDPSVLIAVIEKTNPLPAKRAVESELALGPSVQGLQRIFRLITGMARTMDDWYKKLPPGLGFHNEIKRLITANFRNLLPQLLAYEREAKTQIPGYPEAEDEYYANFSPEWGNPFLDQPENRPSMLFRPAAVIDEENPARCIDDLSPEVKLAAAYPKLREIFTGIYNVYFHIIQVAPTHFQKSLERRDHTAHIALFIAFLMIYRQVQDDLNRITQRHLDFFYKDVLGLKTKPAVPDKAHLFFELAKNVLEHSLEGGIRFKAGKDETGIDLFYELDKTGVFSTAKVESLRTLFIPFEKREGEPAEKIKNIFHAPMADSADGLGAKITDEAKPSWATLGSMAMPKAQIGFAIASNALLLGEGRRTISLDVHTRQETDLAGKTPFDIFLSGEKEWIPAAYDIVNLAGTPTRGFRVKLRTLDEAQPAVAPFDAGTLKEELGLELPVMKIMLHQPVASDIDKTYYYDLLHKLVMDKVVLTVEVNGIRQVTAFNDEGAVDAKKPFLPFGATPKVGSSFYVGHAEAFQKKLKSLSLHLHWEQVPVNIPGFYQGYDQVSALNHDSFTAKVTSIGKTENPSLHAPALLNPLDAGFTLSGSETSDRQVTMTIENTNVALAYLLSADGAANYGIDTKEGFLRLDMQKDFEHDQYPVVLTKQMLASSRWPTLVGGAYYLVKNNDNVFDVQKYPYFQTGFNSVEVIIPRAPYTPSLKSVSLDYTSESDSSVARDASSMTFLHLHPYPDTYQHLKSVGGGHLLPQFSAKAKPGAAPGQPCSDCRTAAVTTLVAPADESIFTEQGALFIGLSGLQPRQSISLLFQMAENTADADSLKSKVRWYYLADNEWKAFEAYQVASDTTDEFIQSGIVELSIPDGINRNNTILPPEWYWLKAAVIEYPGSVSELIGVHAQAARVTFRDEGNDPARLAAPLPPKSIGKLENDDSALKSINQLYQSFGGMPPEDDSTFYTRISERLRHKGRAITLFDYERLVLEAFPGIYKVKCINHTDDQHRLHPGHVLVSVIPDYSKLQAVDRSQPKVTLAQLEKIKRFLEARNCDFVAAEDCTLHVLNPVYEKISVKFDVRFMPEITAIDFHIRKLKEAIIRFLSPWAFDDASEINFGGKVFRSSILHFVEKQPYVDYVLNFEMRHEGESQNLSVIEANTPRTVLVPAPAAEMEINHIGDEHYCPAENLIRRNTLGYINLEDTMLEA